MTNRKLCIKSDCPAWSEHYKICRAGLDWESELVHDNNSVVYCKILGDYELVRKGVIDDDFEMRVNWQEMER